jgi:hypothetical protein
LNWLVRATHSVHIYIVFPLPIKLSYIIFGWASWCLQLQLNTSYIYTIFLKRKRNNSPRDKQVPKSTHNLISSETYNAKASPVQDQTSRQYCIIVDPIPSYRFSVDNNIWIGIARQTGGLLKWVCAGTGTSKGTVEPHERHRRIPCSHRAIDC